MRALMRKRFQHAALLAAILVSASPARAAALALRRHTNQDFQLHTNQDSDVVHVPMSAVAPIGGPAPDGLFWMSYLDRVRVSMSQTSAGLDLSIAVPLDRHGNSPSQPPRGVLEKVGAAQTIPTPGTLIMIGWMGVLFRRSRRRLS